MEREIEVESIDESGNCIKSIGKEKRYYGFWLRFASAHFVPCEKCQEKLEKILENAEFHLGNKDFEPSVEFYQRWDVIDASWRAKKSENSKKTVGTGL
jgi:hypothetical protein